MARESQPRPVGAVPLPRDQAHALRLRMVRGRPATKPVVRQPAVAAMPPPATTTSSPRIMVVTSGKGGVGKTNVAVNLAVNFAQAGQQVLIFDGDLGTANVDVLLGTPPRPGLAAVLTGSRSLEEIIAPGPFGIRVIPGVSGLIQGTDYTLAQQRTLLTQLGTLGATVDLVILDTGAGVSSAVLEIVATAPEALVVVTPEPTAITDAYALIKAAVRHAPQTSLRLVVNQTDDEREGTDAARQLQAVARQFLSVELAEWDLIPRDPHVRMAVRQQKPVVACYPDSPAARAISTLAQRLGATESARATTSAATAQATGWSRLLARLLGRGRFRERAVPAATGASV